MCIHRKVYSELHLPFNLMPILEVFYLLAKREIKASSSTEHKKFWGHFCANNSFYICFLFQGTEFK